MITYDIEAVEKKLTEASAAYYNKTPIMSDEEFDAMWREHAAARAADPENPAWKNTVLDRVGAAPDSKSGFKKVTHTLPMLSLDNVFVREGGNIDEILDWMKSVAPAGGFTVEPKIDGASLRVTYIDGYLVRAVTRGDGNQGDDVTANVVAAGIVPASLVNGLYPPPAGSLETNLEVCMTFEDFEHLNSGLPEEERYSNPRNAASGILQRKNPSEVKGLTAVLHGVAFITNPLGNSYDMEAEELAKRYGLKFAPRFLVYRDLCPAGSDKPIDLAWFQALAKQPYPTDGVVIKVNDYSVRDAMGFTSRAPRWARAVKFEQPEVETTLEDVIVQVGKSGALTPVAVLTPVEVDGSIVARASLHNQDQINRLRLSIGDRVMIRKAAGIIPEVVRSVTRSNKDAALESGIDPYRHGFDIHERFSLYEHVGGKCPCCGKGGLALREEGATVWYCSNPSCTAKIASYLQHACSRKALNIEGIGEEAAAAIAKDYKSLRLDNADELGEYENVTPQMVLIGLLNASVNYLENLMWTTESGGTMTFGRARAEKAYAAIQEARNLPLRRWLFAFAIHTVGENTSKELSRLLNHADAVVFQYTSDNSLLKDIAAGRDKNDPDMAVFQVSHHLGPVSAGAVLDFLGTFTGKVCMGAMMRRGVQSDNYCPIPPKNAESGGLVGKTFVITGTLSRPRDQIQADIEAAGGKPSGSISKKTNYLVAGENAGSKLEKAKSLGVQVITESELYEMME